MLSPDKLSHARSLFPHIATRKIYMNHAATAPLSTPVVDATIQYLEKRSTGVLENFPEDMKMVAEFRSLTQQLINAESPDRMALVCNTSDALNIVSTGIQWKSGDRILLNTAEFPANVYPYLFLKKHGVELDFLKTEQGRVPFELVKKALTPRTRVLALSAVQFLSGYRADLAALGELCRSKGILFVVDAIQAVGAVRIDIQRMKIDALAAGCQKWLLGQQGTGFLYITEELQRNIQQQHVGWLSPVDPWNFSNFGQPLATSARRYEPGTLNIPSLWGTQAALKMLLEFGLANVEQHVLSITRLLIRELQKLEGIEIYSPVDDLERAGIVTVRTEPILDAKFVLDALSARNISISLREGLLRFSPHFYNSPDDIQLTVEALKECFSEQIAG